MAQNITFWYVEPLDAHSNRVIVFGLEEVEEHHDVLCADGKKRNMLSCGYDFISKLRRSSKGLGIKFNIFVKEGTHGKVRLWKL